RRRARQAERRPDAGARRRRAGGPRRAPSPRAPLGRRARPDAAPRPACTAMARAALRIAPPLLLPALPARRAEAPRGAPPRDAGALREPGGRGALSPVPRLGGAGEGWASS